MQTLARSGSTKTGSFHGLRQRLVHQEGPLHYEEKALRQAHDFRAGFKVAKWGVFCHSAWLQISPARFKQV